MGTSAPPLSAQYEEELSAHEKKAAKKLRIIAVEEGQSLRERMLPIAQQVAQGLPSLVNSEKNLLSAFELEEKMQPLLNVKDQLFDMNEQERSYIYHLALEEKKKQDAAQGSEPEQDLLTGCWRALRRSSFNMGSSVFPMDVSVAALKLLTA